MYTVEEVAAMTRLSRSVIYEQMRAGRLHSVREGRSRRIPASAVHDYIELLKIEAAAEVAGV